MGLLWGVLALGYSCFFLAMIIVALVFLTDQISPHQDAIPNFNKTMYNFLYVGLWIIVAVTSLEVIAGVLSIGYLIHKANESPNERVLLEPDDEIEMTGRSPGTRRKLANKARARRVRARSE